MDRRWPDPTTAAPVTTPEEPRQAHTIAPAAAAALAVAVALVLLALALM